MAALCDLWCDLTSCAYCPSSPLKRPPARDSGMHPEQYGTTLSSHTLGIIT